MQDLTELYLTPYPVLMDWIRGHHAYKSGRVRMAYDDFLDVVRLVITAIPIDRDWYLKKSPGLEQSIRLGRFRSVNDHFVTHGFFENRAPWPEQDGRPGFTKFSTIRKMLSVKPIRRGLLVDIDDKTFDDILQLMISAVPVDETWYLAMNAGVAAGIAKGLFASGAAHFRRHGYYEGRMPFASKVDETWYRQMFPDVATRISAGTLGSAAAHFEQQGYREGRLPAPSWTR